MCSKKPKAAIPLWLPFYATAYEELTPDTQDKLLTISAATIDRVLKPVRVAQFDGQKTPSKRLTVRSGIKLRIAFFTE